MAAHSYDAIVIGGGHNGLVTAAYLARGGKRVCVLERRHVLGGAATTEELWPGFKVSPAAYVVSLLLPQIIRELKLPEYGFRVLPRSPSSFTPLPDGRSLLMGPEPGLNQREIAPIQPARRRALSAVRVAARSRGRALEPTLSSPAPDLLPLPSTWRRRGLGKRIRDARTGWDLYQSLGTLGNDMPEALEILTGAARPILDRWFESDVLKATLATDAIIGAFAPISAPGSAYVLLHHVLGEAGGRAACGAMSKAAWARCRGHPGLVTTWGLTFNARLPSAEFSCRAAKCRAWVGRRQQSWRTVVASSIDPHWTFERFLQPDELPAEFLAAVKRIDYSSASAKINLALSEPPQFICRDRAVAPAAWGRTITARCTSARRSSISNGLTTMPSMDATAQSQF